MFVLGYECISPEESKNRKYVYTEIGIQVKAMEDIRKSGQSTTLD